MSKAQIVSRLLYIAKFLDRCEYTVPYAVRYANELREMAHTLAEEIKPVS